jgi:uncharacterized protein (DUF1330 family)
MPAYVIFIRERTLDQSELDAYAKLARPSLEGLPIKFLAAYGRQQALEGPAPEGVAIAEFPSLEDAKQWYEPAYPNMRRVSYSPMWRRYRFWPGAALPPRSLKPWGSWRYEFSAEPIFYPIME